MILEVGRVYKLRDKYAENNAAGKISVRITDFTDGRITFYSTRNGSTMGFQESPMNFCKFFVLYNGNPMKFIYKHRTSTFKPR